MQENHAKSFTNTAYSTQTKLSKGNTKDLPVPWGDDFTVDIPNDGVEQKKSD